jgi:DNA helicase IV
MRIPKESQLSAEQKEICFAPCEGTTFVSGPPGSGKTVVAMYRVRSLENGDAEVNLLVYNKVLRQYTDAGKTFLTWLGNWWRKSTAKPFPSMYEDQQGGGRPWKSNDYGTAVRDIKSSDREAVRNKGHWGHVILDEAQDFPPDAHRLLCVAQNIVFADLDDDERPSLMILADENQRLTSKNSTLEEIRGAHMLTADEMYELRKNYRNSREIAEFARHFYVGLPTGMPEIPEARGQKPTIVLTQDLDESVDRIVRYVRAHEDQEIGVLVYYNKTRKKFFNKLNHRLGSTKITVQSYSSQDAEHKDANKLKFDKGGTVTVICFASAKGLEFDAVFLPELQSVKVDAEHKDEARMNLYVMCSRARQQLFILATDPGRGSDIWSLLPTDSSLYRLEE